MESRWEFLEDTGKIPKGDWKVDASVMRKIWVRVKQGVK